MLNFLILLIFSSLVIPSGQKTVHDKKRTALFCDTQYIKISCRASFGWKEAEARTGNKCLLASKKFNIPFFKKKKKTSLAVDDCKKPYSAAIPSPIAFSTSRRYLGCKAFCGSRYVFPGNSLGL